MAKDVKAAGVETAADVAKRTAAAQKGQGQNQKKGGNNQPNQKKGQDIRADVKHEEHVHEDPVLQKRQFEDEAPAPVKPSERVMESMQRFERTGEVQTLRKNTAELAQIDEDLAKLREGFYRVTPKYVEAIDTKIAALEEEIAALRKEKAVAMDLSRSIAVF
jgi:ribosomal protein L29